MTDRERALIRYIEFNLIGLVESIRPYLKDNTSDQEVFRLAQDVLEEIKQSIEEPTGGLVPEKNK